MSYRTNRRLLLFLRPIQHDEMIQNERIHRSWTRFQYNYVESKTCSIRINIWFNFPYLVLSEAGSLVLAQIEIRHGGLTLSIRYQFDWISQNYGVRMFDVPNNKFQIWTKTHSKLDICATKTSRQQHSLVNTFLIKLHHVKEYSWIHVSITGIKKINPKIKLGFAISYWLN